MDESFLFQAACRPVLFKAVFAFNRRYFPAREMPASLLAMGELGKKLWNDPVVREKLGNAEGNGAGYWDFADETSRLALLDKNVLDALLRHFSSAVLSEKIAHVLERDRLVALRSQLGDGLYQYALRRGRYQVGGLRDFFLPFAQGDGIGKQMDGVSAAVLLTVSSGWSGALLDFLGRHDPEYFAPARNAVAALENGEALLASARTEQKRSLWFTLKKILLREVAPEWAPCFD